MKPMLASDWKEDKVEFPVIAQPKVDGVRGLNDEGDFVGRSGEKPANFYTTRFYSEEVFNGFDGEIAAAHETDPALCRKTSSALNTQAGSPFTLWWLFDYVTYPGTYWERLKALEARVELLRNSSPLRAVKHLRLMPYAFAKDMETLLRLDTQWLDEGYEGTIIRDPEGMHKQGRSTVREGGLLRIKRFIEEEAKVLRIEEGEQNLNEAQTDVHGHQYRSSEKKGMVPNGMVGRLICETLKDKKEITVSPGKMSHDDRSFYFNHPEEIVGQIIKYKHFPIGVKDKPRMATFQAIRGKADL